MLDKQILYISTPLTMTWNNNHYAASGFFFQYSSPNEENELSNYYHNLLYEGLDVRQEGLCWIIKAIWQIGANVQLTYLPTFLDNSS